MLLFGRGFREVECFTECLLLEQCRTQNMCHNIILYMYIKLIVLLSKIYESSSVNIFVLCHPVLVHGLQFHLFIIYVTTQESTLNYTGSYSGFVSASLWATKQALQPLAATWRSKFSYFIGRVLQNSLVLSQTFPCRRLLRIAEVRGSTSQPL